MARDAPGVGSTDLHSWSGYGSKLCRDHLDKFSKTSGALTLKRAAK